MIRRNIRPAQPRAVYTKDGIKGLTGLFRGEPCFVLGNGPSLQDEDLTLVQNYMTVGINRAYMAMDPVILMWQDRTLWDSEKIALLKTKAFKVCRDNADPQKKFHHFLLRTHVGFRLATSTQQLFGGGATGPLAVQLAHAMGCSPIVLLGFDCRYRDGKTDFYGTNRYHSQGTLKNCNRGLTWIKSLPPEQIKILNCSDNSVLGTRHRLADVVAALPSPKGWDHYHGKIVEKLPS
jgi:hypothetical protein